MNRNQSGRPVRGRPRMTGGMAPQLLSLRLGESECTPTTRGAGAALLIESLFCCCVLLLSAPSAAAAAAGCPWTGSCAATATRTRAATRAASGTDGRGCRQTARRPPPSHPAPRTARRSSARAGRCRTPRPRRSACCPVNKKT
jgi:hypothetical protein